jgi:hypothetical protein
MTLDAEEFLRRFVQQVLPRGFVKVRHYGLLANSRRQGRLAVCRRLLLVAGVAGRVAPADSAAVEPAAVRCCRHCGGRRLVYRALPPEGPLPPEPAAVADSS